MQYTTITPKFQVHLPVEVRKKAGLKTHGRAVIKADGKKIIIEPIGDKDPIMQLAGSIKVKHPIPVEKIRDYIDYSDL